MMSRIRGKAQRESCQLVGVVVGIDVELAPVSTGHLGMTMEA